MENKEAIEHLENSGFIVATADENRIVAKDRFETLETFENTQVAELAQKRKELVENTDFTDEDVSTMNVSALDKLIALNKKPDEDPAPEEPETHLDNSLRNGGGADGADKELTDEYLDNALNGNAKKGTE